MVLAPNFAPARPVSPQNGLHKVHVVGQGPFIEVARGAVKKDKVLIRWDKVPRRVQGTIKLARLVVWDRVRVARGAVCGDKVPNRV